MDKPFQRLRRFLRELKRRNVYRVAVTYAAVVFVGLQAVRMLVPATTLPGWADELLIAFAVLGFPIAIVLAWAFEMTAEGVRRTPEAGGEAASSSIYQWIGLALIIALAGGVWYATAGKGESSIARKTTITDTATEPASLASRLGSRSIAVLPFEALGQQQPGPFTEGMHDALLTRLSNVSGLKVISRTAVQQYRGSGKTTAEIARELGVRWVLEGGVQEMGDQIQVNAQLIDPHTETHAWSESYRRDLTAEKLFTLQSEITKKIARSLEAQLTAEEQERVERRPTGDLDAYQLYVQGRNLLDQRGGPAIDSARSYFQLALRRDSSYALAWAGLADARVLHPLWRQPGFSTEEARTAVEAALPGARRAARRALELDSDLAEAHAALGIILITEQVFLKRDAKNGPAILGELTRAVELKPSYAEAHYRLGLVQLVLGRPEPALEHLHLAAELNPALKTAHRERITALLANGEYESAQQAARRARRRFSGMPSAAQLEAVALVHLERWDELRQVVRQYPLEADDSNVLGPRDYTALADLERGDTASVRRRLERLRSGDGPGSPWGEAVLQAAVGNKKEALSALESIQYDVRVPSAGYLRGLRYYYPEYFGPLRDEPRYRELIREINVAWGLNPDGSLPDSVDVSFGMQSDE